MSTFQKCVFWSNTASESYHFCILVSCFSNCTFVKKEMLLWPLTMSRNLYLSHTFYFSTQLFHYFLGFIIFPCPSSLCHTFYLPGFPPILQFSSLSLSQWVFPRRLIWADGEWQARKTSVWRLALGTSHIYSPSVHLFSSRQTQILIFFFFPGITLLCWNRGFIES